MLFRSGRTAEVSALYVGLGRAYYVTAAGDAAGALAELEEAVRLLPLEVEPQLQLALALTARGNDPALRSRSANTR